MKQKRKEKSELVSVIIPAYKKEKTIKKDIKRIYDTMSKTRWDFEVIVIVDGSPDKTYYEAKKIKKKNLFIYKLKNNHGKGYAIRYGMAQSSGKYIVFIDSGMDIDPNGISIILEHMVWYDADVIVASKRHPVSKVNYPFIRKFYSWGYHTLVRFMFGVKVSDTQAGLKVFKRKVLKKVLPRLLVKKFAFDIEILSVARYLGFTKIYTAPIQIEWSEVDTSFDAFLFFDKNIRRMLLDTLAVFYRLKILKYYDDKSKRKWKYDDELKMRINTGEIKYD